MLARTVPGANLGTIRHILGLRYITDDLAIARRIDQLSDTSRKFFRHEFKDPKYQDYKGELNKHLAELTRTPGIEAMFEDSVNTIDFRKIMDEQDFIVIDNSWRDERLGEPASEVFGRIMLSLIRSAAGKRGESRGSDEKALCLFIEQPQLFFARGAQIRRLLDGGRVNRMVVTFVNEALCEVHLEEMTEALLNCGVLMVSPGAEASLWARRLRFDAEVLRNLPADSFYTLVKGGTPFVVNICADLDLVPATTDHKVRRREAALAS